MSSATFRVRRATLDDLSALRPIWESMRLDIADLERRLTEFQVAEDLEGNVVGGFAFQISGRHAWIHSEGFSDFSVTDTVRPLFHERIQALALNHGIARLWTRELAPFWKQQGFMIANGEALKKLPPVWSSQSGGEWLTLSLKDEDALISLEKELALFMAAEKQRTARTFGKARALKNAATILAIIFGLFVAGLMIFLLKKNVGR